MIFKSKQFVCIHLIVNRPRYYCLCFWHKVVLGSNRLIIGNEIKDAGRDERGRTGKEKCGMGI